MVVHSGLPCAQETQSSTFCIFAQRRLCCMCVCERERESGVSFECYLLTLFKICGYKEDLCSRGCICISCPYISANENASVRVKLARKHIATIHSLFFLSLLCCFNSMFISVWFFPALREQRCQLFLWLCSICVPFSWKSQVAAVCITTRKCWV